MTQEQSEFITRLYLEMYNKLFEYARSNLISDSLAEEAVQDTFRIACQKPEALYNSPNQKGWLMNTLKYVICNMRKNQEVSKRILEKYYYTQAETLSQAEYSSDMRIFLHDIAQSEEFILVQGMALEGKSYLELAKERGISVPACRKRMQRAREFLQKKLKL